MNSLLTAFKVYFIHSDCLLQVVCGGCGAKSEPFTFNEMVFYVSTGALV